MLGFGASATEVLGTVMGGTLPQNHNMVDDMNPALPIIIMNKDYTILPIV